MTLRTIDLETDVGEILVSEAQIAEKVAELGARISADYAGRRLTLVSVLKGSLPFMADLMRAIDLPDGLSTPEPVATTGKPIERRPARRRRDPAAGTTANRPVGGR